MGLIKVRKLVSKPCYHSSGFGEYCSRCGSKRTQIGFITEYEEVLESCFHSGQSGNYCAKCGDKIGFGF